jgi:hypothetical protein
VICERGFEGQVLCEIKKLFEVPARAYVLAAMKDGRNDTLTRIGEHFVQKGLLILSVWFVKRILRRSKTIKAEGSTSNGQRTRREAAYKLYLHPLREFKAVNPA